MEQDVACDKSFEKVLSTIVKKYIMNKFSCISIPCCEYSKTTHMGKKVSF